MPTTMTPCGSRHSRQAGNRAVKPDRTRDFVRRFALRGRDPAVADENLYRYCGDDPTDGTDPSGLAELVQGAPTLGAGMRG